jgi:hypothetical protein
VVEGAVLEHVVAAVGMEVARAPIAFFAPWRERKRWNCAWRSR